MRGQKLITNKFIFVLPVIYSIISRNYILGSTVVQAIIGVYMLWACRFFFLKNPIFAILIAVTTVPFQGFYSLTTFVVIAMYFCIKRFDQSIYTSGVNIFLKFSGLYVVISILIFYSGIELFYERSEYDSYLFGGLHRLLGLDGSPAVISVLSGAALIFLFGGLGVINFQLRFFLILVNSVALILTSSRASIIGFICAFIIAEVSKTLRFMYLFFLLLLPFLSVYVYMNSDDVILKFALEQMSSNRVVNWVNALYQYIDSDPFNFVFGLGHLKVLDVAYLDVNLLNTYTFDFVPYSESCWIKIIVCYGVFGLIFMCYFLRLNYLIKNKTDLRMYLFLGFCGVYYEMTFSIQYFYFIFILFLIDRNNISNVRLNDGTNKISS